MASLEDYQSKVQDFVDELHSALIDWRYHLKAFGRGLFLLILMWIPPFVFMLFVFWSMSFLIWLGFLVGLWQGYPPYAPYFLIPLALAFLALIHRIGLEAE